MNIKTLQAKQHKAYEHIDKYFENKYKKATTTERIKIRGVQRAIKVIVDCEYELALSENR